MVRPWGSGVGSAVHCSGVTSDNGPAVTSRNCVLDPRKNETLDVTSKDAFLYAHLFYVFTLRNYLLTPWSGDLFQTLTVSQLVKKFPAFYGTRRFIGTFKCARHLSKNQSRSETFVDGS